MAVMVEEVMTAKSGKSLRVKLGGTWYGAKLDSGLNGAKGKMIEAEIKTLEKFGPWIEAWKESTVAAPQVTPPMQPVGNSPPTAAPAVAAPRYAEPNSMQWLPMASNVVAHAIAAGKIESPNQVGAWVRAVQMAVLSLPNEDDSDLPF